MFSFMVGLVALQSQGKSALQNVCSFISINMELKMHLKVLNQESFSCVVDQRVECVGVLGQSVVIVKAVDVHFLQADLVVGIDHRGVKAFTRTWRDQV